MHGTVALNYDFKTKHCVFSTDRALVGGAKSRLGCATAAAPMSDLGLPCW